MTDRTIDPDLLPPIAWQRGSRWGRDITAYARDQDERIADLHIVEAFEIASSRMTTIEAIIVTSRYRGLYGSLDIGAMHASRSMDADQWDRMLRGRYHEIDIATALSTFIMEGSRVISLGPDLVAQAEADESADLPLDALSQGGPSFYVNVEGTDALSYDGRPLDGFLVSFEDFDADHEMHLHVTPMTRDNQEPDAPNAPAPTMCLAPLDGNVTISDAIRSAANTLLVSVVEQERLAQERATEDGEKRSLFRERSLLVMKDEIELARKQSEITARESDRWARLIGTALNCLVNRGPEAVSGFPPEAPKDLVEKVNKGGVGARKAEQRLIASGYPRWTRYEIGQQATVDTVEPEPVRQIERVMVPPASVTETSEAPKKADKRKSRRLERQAISRATPFSADTTPAARADDGGDIAAEPENREVHASYQIDPLPQHDDELLEKLSETLRRCFTDLPSIESRNWESAFPPALAAMVMRRARVAQLPRETSDATRRRLAADILPRLQDLPALLQRLRTEEAANARLLRAFEIERASISRDIEQDVVDAAAHPILVTVRNDDELARRILFPGVERESAYLQDRTVVVRAWREERTLHLMGIVHDGCLTGFRRVEYDLDERTVTVFDAEADDADTDALVDALYAPIADVVLGPVEEADAWRHRRVQETRAPRNTFAPAVPATQREITTETVGKPEGENCAEPTTDADFVTWDSVRRPCAQLDAEDLAGAREVMDRNAVARAVLRTLDHDGDAEGVRHALTRHLSGMDGQTRLDVLLSPNIDDDADLAGKVERPGVLVVTDLALVEHASPGIVAGSSVSREKPLCVIYRQIPEGIAALVIQPTADNLINLAQWTLVSPTVQDDESDLDWYIRGAIAAALSPKQEVDEQTRGASALPALTRNVRHDIGTREGPRRIVAQARIRPENMQLAAAAAAAWFDAQVQRHGEALVEDRRLEGDWTIEHESNERGVQSRWSVTLHVAEDEEGALDIVVRTTLATGVKPRLPTLVREIAAATPTEGPDGRLLAHPKSVRTKSDLNELLRHLQSSDRQLPTLVMTQDRSGQYARDPQEIARQSLGAMNVWLVADHLTYELSDTLGQEYRTFGGAARVFQPRFDPDVDPASRHPRIMNDSGVDRALAELISRASAATTTRYNIPDAMMRLAPRPDAREDTTANEPTLPLGLEAPSFPAVFPAQRPMATPVAEIATPSGPRLRPAKAVPVRTVPQPASEEPETVEATAPEPVEKDKVVEPEAGAPEAEPVATAPHPGPAVDTATNGPGPDDAQAEASAPAAVPATIDLDVMVGAIDQMLERRLESLGIGKLLGTVSALATRVAALTDAAKTAVPIADVQDRDAEILRLQEEMRAERETAQELLSEAETQRQSALDEVEILRQALNERRRDEIRGTTARQWPADLSGLAEWIERNALPNVVITAKAWRAMRKVRYTDMERLCSTLQLLDGAYIDMRAGEEGAKQRWDDGLKTLRLESKKQSQNGKGIRGGNEYRFEHEGVRWEMDFHLRGTESLHNEPDRLLRIYFAYDKERGRVMIGHMPTHLTTIDS